MAQATFDYPAFVARYPEFSSADAHALASCFDEATLYLSNADNSIVADVRKRQVLLHLLTAHIATLRGYTSADGRARPFGVLTSATEGSVSVGYQYQPGTKDWYMQTQYGASFWQATLPYRQFRYVPQKTVIL